MLSKFFLARPVFAWVIAIAMMAAGLLAIHGLPIAQYPPIAPPAAPAAKDRVVDELEQTIIHLCERIRGEPRADECLTLMKAVAKGAAALAALAQR